MAQLDKHNRKILFELDRNSRAPYSQIATSVGLSPETARYRVKSLVASGVVFKFHTITDTARLGHSLYKVFLKLHSADEQTIEEMIAHCVSTDTVTWVVRFDGSFDFCVQIRARQMRELSEFIDHLTEKYNQFLSKRSFSVNILSEYLVRDYFVRKKRNQKNVRHYAASGDVHELDATNLEIIRLMAIDSRISAADIATELKRSERIVVPISREAVLQRIKRLEREQIITGYNIVLNHGALDQLHYKILLYVNYVTPEKISAFVESCKGVARIVYVIKTLGEWDLELDLEVESVAQYREILADLSRAHPGIIRDYTALLITKIYKYNTVPTID